VRVGVSQVATEPRDVAHAHVRQMPHGLLDDRRDVTNLVGMFDLRQACERTNSQASVVATLYT